MISLQSIDGINPEEHNDFGIVPINWLECKDKLVNFVINPIDDGIIPVNWF
jgi:hypothetical protein